MARMAIVERGRAVGIIHAGMSLRQNNVNMVLQTALRCLFNSCKYPVSKNVHSVINRRTYRILRPGKVSPTRYIPDHIVKPLYAVTGEIPNVSPNIEIKTEEQIKGVTQACQLAKQILIKAGNSLKAGITTDDIDQLVHEETILNNAYPSPLLYKGFPKSVCTSVNNVVCHGIPDDVPLEDGDILNIDVTVYLNGFHGDTSATFCVGEVDEDAMTLMEVGKTCLQLGISVCKPGAQFCDIGEIISEYAYSQGYSVIPEFIGHGIGSFFHGPPEIFHVPFNVHREKNSLQQMKPGMVFTIEPIISEGTEQFEILSDGWTCVSKDNLRSVQYEHTVLVTEHGVKVLTE